jgi:hypothetical protein
MKPPRSIILQLDITVPAKTLVDLRAGCTGLLDEMERLLARKVDLQIAEHAAETVRALSDIRLELELVNRKLVELEQRLGKAREALALGMRRFWNEAERAVATTAANVAAFRSSIIEEAMKPHQEQLKSVSGKLSDLRGVILNSRSFEASASRASGSEALQERELLRWSERLIAAAEEAQSI